MDITIRLEDIAHSLANTAADADSLGQSELRRLSSLNVEERAALALEYDRLKDKYGDQSPQAMSAAAQLKRLDEERASIEMQIARESTAAPPAAADHFAIYGRVLDSKGTGVVGMTVSAMPQQGSVSARIKTVESGAFELTIKVTANAGGAGATASTFQLEVSKQKPRFSYLYPEVFEVAPNHIAYRELVLPDSESS